MSRNYKSYYYSKSRRAWMDLGDDIEHVKVFERDGWICGICNESINKYLRCPDKFCATLDHIVPRRYWTGDPAGWHTYENTQASHWICNMVKSDSLTQMPA